jgi:hypothetical protein
VKDDYGRPAAIPRPWQFMFFVNGDWILTSEDSEEYEK